MSAGCCCSVPRVGVQKAQKPWAARLSRRSTEDLQPGHQDAKAATGPYFGRNRTQSPLIKNMCALPSEHAKQNRPNPPNSLPARMHGTASGPRFWIAPPQAAPKERRKRYGPRLLDKCSSTWQIPEYVGQPPLKAVQKRPPAHRHGSTPRALPPLQPPPAAAHSSKTWRNKKDRESEREGEREPFLSPPIWALPMSIHASRIARFGCLRLRVESPRLQLAPTEGSLDLKIARLHKPEAGIPLSSARNLLRLSLSVEA